MLRRDLFPTAVALLAYAVMSGLLTPTGVILGAAAHALGAPVTQTAALFSALTGGNLVGIVLCFALFERLSLRAAISVANAAILAGVATLTFSSALPLAIAGLGIAGVGSGVGLSAGAVIISRIYAQRRRAMAFLGTDCAFSVAGFVFPSLAALALARGFPWQTAYVAAAAVSATILIAAQRIRFPAVAIESVARETGAKNAYSARALVRAGLCGAALCAYLVGQGAFLLWAPTALESAGVPAAGAGNVVGTFWGPSIFGLITAAIAVTRIAPRVLLVGAGVVATALVTVLAGTTNATSFFTLTALFGFCSTCMYKLMISVGSEQLADAPPRLVTFLLLSGSLGSTLAPAVSALVAGTHGPRAALALAATGYACAVGLFVVALWLERSHRAHRAPTGALDAQLTDPLVS
jgi:MFS transporter, TsgA protein